MQPLHPRTQFRSASRRGAAMAEFALVFPVYMMVMLGLMEFGRAYMITEILNVACRAAAHQGVTEGSTTPAVIAKIKQVVAAGGLDSAKCTVYVIDAAGFDSDPLNKNGKNGMGGAGGMLANYPANQKDLATAQARSLAIFRAEMKFSDAALLPPMWLGSATLMGQVVMRKE